MNNIYNINWVRLVSFFLPPLLRKSLILAFINTCLSPLRSSYTFFLEFKHDANYKLKHNSQLCYLQKMLNDKFDRSLRRIKIKNVTPRILSWVYYPEDEKPLYTYNKLDSKPLYVYHSDDYVNEFDFEIFIPLALQNQESQMIAQINYYKLFSKNYKIITL